MTLPLLRLSLDLLLPLLSLCAVAGMGLALARQRRREAQALADCQNAQARALEFHRQTLRAATEGKLQICGPEDVPALLRGERLWTMPLLEASDVSLFRRHLRAIAVQQGLADGRLDDLCSCVSEAAANAVRHSGGGVAQVWAATDALIILVSDCGQGLAPDALWHDAVSQGEGLGIGFRLMLALSDTLALCTGPEGTQLVLTIYSRADADRPPDESARLGTDSPWAQAA